MLREEGAVIQPIRYETRVFIASPSYVRSLSDRAWWRFALLVALFTPMGVQIHISSTANGKWRPVRFVRRER